VPVASLIRAPSVLEVNPSVPARTVAEFIAYAKANPGKLTMASSGIGTPSHVVGELFKFMTGVNLVHLPYRGTAPALTDLLGGQVQVLFNPLTTSIEYIRAGKLRALAVTVMSRAEALPDIPTVAEFLPGFEASLWYGIAAPRNTPVEVIDRQAQHGGQRGPRRPEAEGAACRVGRHGTCGLTRRLRQTNCRGDREVGQGDPGGQYQGGVSYAPALSPALEGG